MLFTRKLWFFLIILQLTHSAFGCDYRTLDAEAKSYVQNIWLQGSTPVSKETIKDHLYFITDEEKIDKKYKEEDHFKRLCDEIKSQIKNARFLEFLKNCELIYYDGTSDPEEKYATHILLEAVKSRFNFEQGYFDHLNASYKKERESQKVIGAFKDISISAK